MGNRNKNKNKNERRNKNANRNIHNRGLKTNAKNTKKKE
jgi:hypothetical protein